MNPVHAIWFVASFAALVALVRLMNARQTQLTQLLCDYVERQIDWVREKAKTARLARKIAEEQKRKQEAAEKLLATVTPDPAETTQETDDVLF